MQMNTRLHALFTGRIERRTADVVFTGWSMTATLVEPTALSCLLAGVLLRSSCEQLQAVSSVYSNKYVALVQQQTAA